MNYDDITHSLLQSANDGRIALRDFRSVAEHIVGQLRRDSLTGCFSFWGQSRNVDEHEQKKIVDPKILSAIGRCAGYPIRDDNAYHAGLMHTYGYLFSQLKTRFGYKRDRWTSGVIEAGLGLDAGCCSPTPCDGTLLQNVTHLLSRVCFGGRGYYGANSTVEDSISANLQQQTSEISLSTRITETVRIQPEATSTAGVSLKVMTDLIRFAKPVKKNIGLIVYWYQFRKQRKLVTCFPATDPGWTAILEAAGDPETFVRPRFNLFLHGFPKGGLPGEQSVVLYH